jgi:hypothetical protein
MDTSIKVSESQPEKKIIGWECSTDGKHFVQFPEKRCRYCLPVYEDDE